MRFSVVDTNVPVVANGAAPQASPGCVQACVCALRGVVAEGGIVLDAGGLILREYVHNLNRSGEPGLGDAFYKWVWDHQVDDSCCERVAITPRAGMDDDFVEFPTDPELRGFHRKDRKFVAVAVASERSPEILNAVDPGWWTHREALARNGVQVRFLCLGEMEAG